MPINEFSILIANRIQEKSNVTISYLASRYEKSPSTIRRTILELNDHIALEKQFIITDATIISQLSYTDLIQAISALKITDYATNSYERLDYLMVISLTEKYINLTTMYNELEISQSTRKKDRTLFSDLLKEREFVIKSFPSKGIQVIGEEQHYRIELAKILAKVIEIDENNRIIERLANNPIQKLIYLAFSQYMSKNIIDMNYIEELLNKHEVRINYSSKKFLFVYYLIAFCRIREAQNVRETNFPEIPDFFFFNEKEENNLINAILASLDYNKNLSIPTSPELAEQCDQFVEKVEQNIVTTFYTRTVLIQEIYDYIYKVKIRNTLKYDFYDNKLDHVSEELPFLFKQVTNAYRHSIEPTISMSKEQLSTLVLIFRKHVLKNKIMGRNTKKIVIISNSAKEKTAFFAEQLTYHFDVDIIDTLHINELYLLNHLNFDTLITFSNRISKSLQNLDFPIIKTPYFLHHEEIDYLLKLSFSSNSHRKLVAEEFVEKVQSIEKDQLSEYLKEVYPNFFV